MMKVQPFVNTAKSSTIVLENDLQMADKLKAEKYKQLNMVTEIINGTSHPYPFSIPNEKFSRYGVGLHLYFDFVFKSAIILFCMFLVSIPVIYSNTTGNGLSSHKNVNEMMKTSLANQPQLVILTTLSTNQTLIEEIARENKLRLKTFVDDGQKRHLLCSGLDMLYCVIFLFYLYIFNSQTKEIISEDQKNNLLPYQYALSLSGFPETISNADEIKQFLQNLKYDIYEVKIARNYYNTLFLHREEANLIIKIRIETLKNPSSKNITNWKAELSKIKQNLDKIIETKVGAGKKHDQYPSLLAFVIFESQKQKIRFIKEYRPAVEQSICGKTEIQPKYLLQQKFPLEIEEIVDNPSNIKWENLEVKSSEKAWRLCIVFLVVIALMIITFIIVFVANIVKPPNPDACPQENYTYEQTVKMVNNSISDKDKSYWKDCFCMSQSVDKIYGDSTLQSYCKDTLISYTVTQAINILTAFVIIIVNSLLRIMLEKLSNFVRYPSWSKEISGTMTILYVVMFINTAIITLLLNSDIFGFKPALIISAPIPPLKEAQDTVQAFSSDLDRDWYVSVGSKIINTWIISIVSPHILNLIFLPLLRWYRQKKVQYNNKNFIFFLKAMNAFTQREMNNYIVGPQFQLHANYAQTLNTIYVTLFFCSGMPLMLLFGSAALFTQYIAFKYLLIRYNKKPPAYDEQLHKRSLKVLPWGIVLHLCIGIYTYGSPLIFTIAQDSLSVSVTNTALGSQASMINQNAETAVILQRLSKTPWLSALLFAILAWMVIQTFFLKPVKRLFTKCCCKKNKIDVEKVVEQVTYKEAFEQISQSTLASYEIKLNETYKDIIQAMELGNHKSKIEESQTLLAS